MPCPRGASSEGLGGAARRQWLLHEEQRDAASQAERPEGRSEVGPVGNVRADEADAQDDEGCRESVDDVLGCVVMLSHQDAGDEERQYLKAIELGRMGTSLPALKASQPLSRIVVVETAFATRFAEAP